MADKEKVTTTNGEALRWRNALALLGQRKMYDLRADLKVAFLLRAISKYTDPIDSVKRRASLDLLTKLEAEGADVGLSSIQEQFLAMRSQDEQAKVDEALIEMELPLLQAIKKEDLPKELTGPEGYRNAAGLGALIADLGPLFVMAEEFSENGAKD